MSRRCSHGGHNSRTCLDGKGGFKLFGVHLSAECCMPGANSEVSTSSAISMRKSVSMGNLCNYGAPEEGASLLSATQLEQHDLGDPGEGYASDDLVHSNYSSSRERKKGVPWTEEEHRSFLTGLQTLGKGDWRGISRNFVITRTPTQVASHAQKYFLRRNNLCKRRRRSSLFDITPDTVSSVLEEPIIEETADADVSAELSLGQSILHGPNHSFKASCLIGQGRPCGSSPVAAPHFPLSCISTAASDWTRIPGKPLERQAMKVIESGTLHQSTDVDVMEIVPEAIDAEDGNYNIPQSHIFIRQPTMYPGAHINGWSKSEPMDYEFKILKPIPIVPNSLQKADGTIRIPELTINMARPVMEPTPLSFELLGAGSRHSAFHVTVPKNGSRDVNGRESLTSAISVP